MISKQPLLAYLATLAFTAACSGQDIVAAFDVNSGASPTETGFTALNNTVNGNDSSLIPSPGITLTTTPAASLSSGYRDRGTGGALATAAQQALQRDFIFWNGSATTPTSTVTFNLAGLENNKTYEITYYTYNQGSFQRQASYYKDSPSGPLLSSFTTPGNKPDEGVTSFTILASASGEITFVAVGDDPAQSSVAFNGLTVKTAAPIPPDPLFQITDLLYNKVSDEITLTWTSNPGQFYGIYWSDDLAEFAPGVNPAVPAAATGNVTSYGPFANPLPGANKAFFRIGPPDLEDPKLNTTWGSDSTITLNFSEPLLSSPATNPANFVVTKNDGTPVAFNGVTLSPDGTTITLALTAPLDIGTPYTVAMNNLTDLAGRALGDGTLGNFQTYDNNPNGVKVFILAGQSNMVGHGHSQAGVDGVVGAIGSLRYMAVTDTANYAQLLTDPNNPATSPWATRSDVKVWWRDSDLNSPRAVLKGDLAIGFSEGRNANWFGPEYGFGWVMGDHYTTEPVLIIKAAWGGKSLHTDFRPPGAVVARGGAVGPYYTGMIEYVRDCLSNLGTEFPEWAGMGYQIAGFGWRQGWNDGGTNDPYAEYEANLANLINDLRAEFGRPVLPVAIANSGFDGWAQANATRLAIINAQLAVANPSLHPEFVVDGVPTVFTAETRGFWRPGNESPTPNQGYHWFHNGETHFLIGDAMGDAMVDLLTP